jgi:D-alanyl-D-alanine carboxypeptidase
MAEAPAANQTVAAGDSVRGTAGKTIRVNGLVTRSYRPVGRPVTEEPAPELLLSASSEAEAEVVVAEAVSPAEADVAPLVDQDIINAVLADAVNATLMEVLAEEAPAPVQVAAATPAVTPQPRPEPPAQVQMAAMAATAPVAPTAESFAPAEPEVVTRVSTSGGRHWGVNVGRYTSRFDAERVLLQVALNEMSTLDGSLRRVVQRSGGFDANFMGLTREGADLACRRLQARGTTCFMIGAEG